MAGNATIGALRVSLGIDSAQFDKGLKSAQGSLAGFGKAAGLVGAAVGVALAGAAVALGAAMKHAIDRADELSKMSQKVGVAVEELSRLKYAADLSDVSLGQLAVGLKKLDVNMTAIAGNAGGPAAAAFKALGLSATDASGQLKSPSAMMTELAGKFAGMQDGAAKTAMAVAIFGKSGSDLIPLLNEGKSGLAAMNAEADALGLTLDSKTGKAAEAFNDNLTRLKAVKDGIVTQITARMLPALEMVSTSMVAAAKDTKFLDVIAFGLTGTLKVLVTAATVVGAVFKAMGAIVGGVSAAVILAAKGDFAGALAALKTGAVDLGATLGKMGDDVKKVWVGTGAAAKASADKQVQALAPVMQLGTANKKQLTEQEKAYKKAQEAADRYVESLQHEVDTYGRKAEDVKLMEAQKAASDALDAGLTHQAATILRLAEALRELQKNQKLVIDADVEMVRTSADLKKAWGHTSDTLHSKFATFFDDVDAIRGAFDELYYGLKNQDWTTAFSGLLRAFDSIKKAFATSGMAGGLAATASAAGSAIGGVAGGTLSGAGTGAAIGSVFGPIGTVVGAILGGIAGFFGASSAKKQQQQQAAQQAAAQAAAEAAQRAQALADAKRELEIRLMELSGDALGALAARRADELAALDPTLRALQAEIYAKEDLAVAQQKLAEAQAQAAADAAAAAAKAEADAAKAEAAAQAEAERLAAIAASRRELEIQLMEEGGDAVGALAARRADELAALDPTLRGLQSAVWAVHDAQAALAEIEDAARAAADAAAGGVTDARAVLTDAYDREAQALQGVIDRNAAFADSLGALGRQLADQTAAFATPGAQYASARASLSALRGRGDQASLSAIPGGVSAFLGAAQAFAPNAQAYKKDLAFARQVVAEAEGQARDQMANAAGQLAALQQSVSGLLAVNDNLVGVREAVDLLTKAMTEAAAAQLEAQTAMADALARVAGAAEAANPAGFTFAPDHYGDPADKLAWQSAMVPAGGAASPIADLQANAEAALFAIAANTAGLAKIQRAWDGNGMPATRVV